MKLRLDVGALMTFIFRRFQVHHVPRCDIPRWTRCSGAAANIKRPEQQEGRNQSGNLTKITFKLSEKAEAAKSEIDMDPLYDPHLFRNPRKESVCIRHPLPSISHSHREGEGLLYTYSIEYTQNNSMAGDPLHSYLYTNHQ